MDIKPAKLTRDNPDFFDERAYEEELRHIGGTLVVGLNRAYIFFCFINKNDARFNPRSFQIEEEDINYYIKCWKEVFATYKEEKSKMKPTRFLEQGYSCGFVLRINMPEEGVAIHEWADPIKTDEEYNAVIDDLKYAKKRIRFLREHLQKLAMKK